MIDWLPRPFAFRIRTGELSGPPMGASAELDMRHACATALGRQAERQGVLFQPVGSGAGGGQTARQTIGYHPGGDGRSLGRAIAENNEVRAIGGLDADGRRGHVQSFA